MKKHDKLLDVLHGTAKGLHEAGTMDAMTMREFDALCLPPVHEYSAAQIKRLRLRFKASQAVFAAYLEQVLLPGLRPGQVVVVDNVGAHKPDRMRALVEAAGCRLVFLPAYSPDLSPVEEAFSKIKALVKAAGARTRAALDAAIAVALAAVSASDAAGWFTHAGYPTPQAA